ncbi:MAG: VOC family protein [Clostridiales bacterium]|jgi:predicted enzyme related to lactoylglutathione lyase|nr:VOC family protein [Clostridiales bacterium]
MIRGILIGDISIDCNEPEKLQNFYGELLGWDKRILWGCPAIIKEGYLVILFMKPDEQYSVPIWPEMPGAQQKQMHFNFQVDDLQTAVSEAISLGAVKADNQYGGDDFVTLLDPEGHPFCLCRK